MSFSFRNTYKNTYDGPLSPQFLRSYLTAAKISSTTVTKTTASSDQNYHPSMHYPEFKKQPEYKLNLDYKIQPEYKPQPEYNIQPAYNIQPNYKIQPDYKLNPDYKNLTICKKNKIPIVAAADESQIINVAQPSQAVEDTLANSMSKIDQPYQPYVTHTYFTLDDVILPYIPEHNSTAKTKQENLSQFESQKEDEDKTTSNNETLNTLFDLDFFNIEPITSTALITTTASTTTTKATTTTTTAEAPQSTFEPRYKPDFYTESTQLATLSPTEPLTISNTTSNLKSWNSTLPNLSPRKILKLAKNYTNSCDNCRKVQSTARTLSNLEEAKLKRSSSLLKKIEGNESKYSKKLAATKLNLTQIHKNKTLPTFIKNYSVANVTATTEATQPKSRRSKTSFVNLRRRKFHGNSYNTTPISSINDNVAKPEPEVKAQNITSDISKSRKAKPTSTTASSVILSTSPAPSKATTLASESAIMTISNTNVRKMKRIVPRFKKIVSHDVNATKTDFAHTTDLPQLPIEVYFTKLNQK